MAEINTTWTYNGHEFSLDMDDIETLELYDAACAAMQSAQDELPSGASEIRRLIAYCEGIRRMMDTLFGEGTAEKLLGGSRKPSDYDDLYDDFTDFIHNQTAERTERRKKILSKYGPNRAARRAIERAAEKIKKAK